MVLNVRITCDGDPTALRYHGYPNTVLLVGRSDRTRRPCPPFQSYAGITGVGAVRPDAADDVGQAEDVRIEIETHIGGLVGHERYAAGRDSS